MTNPTKTDLPPAQEELLCALMWLLRVSQGGAYDDDDHASAHENAEQIIEKYNPPEEDEDD